MGSRYFSTATNTVSFANTPLLLGEDNPANYLDGDWAEVLIYDHELSAPERLDLITYLNARYDLGAN